ncbi:MAG: aminodeoxychorismate/anthranilate synthase component II [Planctomycetaceae bacterium]|jgi:anthranilate synthase/aminodeoxychorismate synthase-like glutamine amidotransferase|nr:aminodeoxychorismate/anthranilate synthase component II [Planctomycetaceae bacterium]
MLLLIDNYDSFTWNLVQRLGEIDPSLGVEVYRNDRIDGDAIAAKQPSHILISPGPCTPNEAGVSCDVVRRFAGRMPILGVCLGHQAIGQVFGGKIVAAQQLMHGKVDQIEHTGVGVFAGLSSPINATRYHSLVIEPSTLPQEFIVDAWASAPNGGREIMAIRHRELPLYGVQFHPESFLTPHGYQILRTFLGTTRSDVLS